MIDYYSLAPLNSILNAIAAALLMAGFIFIRKRWVRAHRACMLSAFGVSTAFFISYLTYHYHVGDVRFQGHGIVRPIYFTILITHIVLAATIVPLVLITLWRAFAGQFPSASADRALDLAYLDVCLGDRRDRLPDVLPDVPAGL